MKKMLNEENMAQAQTWKYDCACKQFTGCTASDNVYQEQATTHATGAALEQELAAQCTATCQRECTNSTFAERNGISVHSLEEALGVAQEKVKPWERWGFFGPPIHISKQDSVAAFFVLSLYLVLGVWAAWKSWSFNTQIGKVNALYKTSMLAKLFYSLVALFFGPLYLLAAEVSQRTHLLRLIEHR